VKACEIDKQAEVPLPQRLSPQLRPLLETILRQELTAIESDRGPMALEARSALSFRRGELKLLDVNPEPVGRKHKHVMRQTEACRSVLSAGIECAPRDEQRLSEVVRSRPPLPIRPERLDHSLSMKAMPWRQHEQLEQPARLTQPPSCLIHARAIHRDTKPAEKPDVQLRSR
jgi:hypothetical protein